MAFNVCRRVSRVDLLRRSEAKQGGVSNATEAFGSFASLDKAKVTEEVGLSRKRLTKSAYGLFQCSYFPFIA